VRRRDGSVEALGLDAAVNPAMGAVVQYALRRAPERAPEIAFFDASGVEVRRYTQGVPGALGLCRFVWNLRLPGVEPVTAPDLDPWQRPDGPRVLAGDYEVRLSVDGLTLSAPLRVEPDPRRRASTDDLREQFAFLLAVRDQLGLCNRTINAIDAQLGRVRALAPTAGGSVSPVVAQLEALRGGLIDVHMRGAQLWPSGVHEKLNALFAAADSADAAPTRQEREVLATLAAQVAAMVGRLEAILDTPAMRAVEAATATARTLFEGEGGAPPQR
jgi:hypothetical protein